MAVKTPGGLTDRQTMKNLVLQGDTWGSIMASVQVDAICKDVEKAGLGIKHKNSLEISTLALVDDIIGVSEAGYKAVQMNSVINVKTAEKCLQFGVSKCKSMFVGKDKNDLLDSELLVDKWELKQAEAEVVPSSSLVEVGVEVEVVVEVFDL